MFSLLWSLTNGIYSYQGTRSLCRVIGLDRPLNIQSRLRYANMRSVSTLKYCLLATGFPMRTRVVGFMLGGYRICLLQKVYYFTLFSPPIL